MRTPVMGMLILLAGCETIEYGPAGQRPAARYAYSEQPDGDSRYVLRMIGPHGADMSTMKSMWDRRARELCGGTAYSKAMYRAERGAAYYAYNGAAPGAPVLEGFLDCTAAPEPRRD